MRLSISAGFVVMVSSAVLVPAQDFANPWTFPDFSATEVIQSAKFDMQMKVYRSGSTVRIEKTAALATLYTPQRWERTPSFQRQFNESA